MADPVDGPSQSQPEPERLKIKKKDVSGAKRKRKRKKDLEALKRDQFNDDHLVPLPEIYARLQTDPDTGLSNEEALKRLIKDGLNELTPPRSTPQIFVFCKHMFSGFSLILWISAILCFVAYAIILFTADVPDKSNLYLGIIIVIVVVLTGIFGYFQDRSSTKIMDSFKKMISHSATVIRDGKPVIVDARYLAKGDIVLVKFGDKIPADIRIIENFGMKVDNSSLTGETEPQPRGVEPTNVNPMETQNLAFYSTSAMEGTCKGVVIEVGDRTFIGRLASLTVGLKRVDSPITVEIKYFVKLITVVSLLMAGVFFVISVTLGNPIIDCVIYFIAILVANIPEGLLITVTLTLTLTAKKMAKKNCLIKCLDSVETLGSTSTICSDKTGTLTQNRMTVLEIVYGNKVYPVKYASNRSSTVENEFRMDDGDFKNLMRCARLCLRADFEDNEKNAKLSVLDKLVEGDASEAGILKCVECIFSNVREYRKQNPKVMEVPFNSTNKYQLSIHRTSAGNVLLMKGAPEKILELCSTISLGGRGAPLSSDLRQRVNDILIELGSKGERVLGKLKNAKEELRRYKLDALGVSEMQWSDSRDFRSGDFRIIYSGGDGTGQYGVGLILGFCDAELSDAAGTVYDSTKKNYPTSGLRFLGLMALIDPPREAVPDAVARCKSAGVRVIMVTGDHPVTAEAIAKKVGIISGETAVDIAKRKNMPITSVPQSEVKAIVVPGDRLREMSNDELDKVLMDHEEIVFARTTPTQKLLIVEGCQRLGYITAVTGDGVNDSPALKKADIGVAMGIAGSDVSKQAADMILLDDNFASIVTGVEQGRIIFDNLKKSIAYVLTSNIPEMAPFIFYIILGLPLPLTAVAMLIVDVGTDMLPAISLAFEPAESDIMMRRPRNPFYDKLVNRRLIWMAYGQIGLIQTAAAFSGYFLVMGQFGFLPEKLLWLREDWENEAVMVTDSFGQQWSYDSRMALEHYCQSCYFIAIMVTQLADVVICKTRRNSLIQQGMRNWVLNAGMVTAVVLSVIVLYTPGMDKYLFLPPIRFVHWLPGVPFALLIIVFDETRRYCIRRHPGGWVEREFYY